MFPSAKHILSDSIQSEFNQKPSLLESVFISYSQINDEANHESSSDEMSIASESHIKKHKKHKRKKEKKKQKEKIVVKNHSKNNSVFLDDMIGVSFEDAFRIDRSPEVSIKTFGCTYVGHVSNYRKLVRSTLGLDRFDPYRKALTKQEVLKKYMKTRYFSRKNYAKARRVCTKVTTRCDNMCVSSTLESSINDDNEKNVSVNLKEETFSENEMDFEQLATGEKVRQIKIRLHDNPQDVETWLKLADLQEDAVRYQLMDAEFVDNGDAAAGVMSRHHSQVSHRIVYDKRQAVLQRAQVANPGSVELKLYQMQTNFGYVEAEILRRDWQQLVFTHPNNMDAWLRYFDFLENDFVRYTTRAVLPVYNKCLSTAARLLSGVMLSHTVLPNTWWKAMGLWGRHVSRLSAAGFTERATALWQAQIQLMLKGPSSREELETWWESGAPRFGEPKWSLESLDQDEQLDDDDAGDADAVAEKEESNVLLDATLDDVTLLVKIEKIREEHLWRPWRCKEPDGKDDEPADLDRQVVVEDFFGVLLPFSRAPDTVRRYFMLLFLVWHGAQCTFSKLHTLCSAFPHFFTWLEPFLCRQQLMQHVGYASASRSRWLRNCLRQCSSRVVHNAQYLLLCDYIRNAQLSSDGSASRRELRSIARRLLAKSSNRNDLALWSRYAQSEWDMGRRAEARKIFDTALAAAGQLKWPSSFSDGEKVWRDSLEHVELIRVYLELELDLPRGIDDDAFSFSFTEGNPVKCCVSRAQELLMHASLSESLSESYDDEDKNTATGMIGSGGVILRARYAAQQHAVAMQVLLQSLPSNATEDHLNLSMRLFALSSYMAALFELLFVGELPKISTILRACSIQLYSKRDSHKESSPIIAAQFNSQAAEVARWEAQIAWWDARRRQAYLADARKILARGVRLHPSDAGLLSLVTKWESGASCRRLLDMAVTAARDVSLLPGLVALNVDLERWEKSPHGAGALYRLRTTLERLLSTYLGRTTPLLWSQFVRIECRMGSVETYQRRVRDALFRALREVPWSKALYLEGSMALQRWPESSQEVLDLLIEKELRQRVLLEEVSVLRESVSILV